MISRLIPSLPDEAWIRSCNECGHHQVDKMPLGEMTEAYRNRKCKRCKSEALDYGTSNASDDSWANEEVI